MKHIKAYEDISKTPKFEIGDYVKLKNSRNYIYQITDYHTVLDEYYLEDTLEERSLEDALYSVDGSYACVLMTEKDFPVVFVISVSVTFSSCFNFCSIPAFCSCSFINKLRILGKNIPKIIKGHSTALTICCLS